ncbi:hypothetical protein AZF00_01140 [Zhongshania aliphaticivorans]|uniref:Methyltransferase type 11 domain-containing protein n=1 Tax=Zhongshania aliphaticivorans TaxID=1470434 RepID=A0A127M173_9GAMM|nr:hypothetical protein AZF00_01140 [Zhongshania aliphaticivorans]
MDVVAGKNYPKLVKRALRRTKHVVLAWAYRGSERYCPLCENSASKFLEYGATKRKDAECIYCGSLERHRLLWIFLTHKTDLMRPASRRLLHIAPEQCLGSKLKHMYGRNYLSADIEPGVAMACMDITEIQFGDNSFDIIFCSHVLEHVPEDKKALSELYRVLKPGGWAIILVPIEGERTIEDPAISTPEDRIKAYGQADHVRQYGRRDYMQMLNQQGLAVIAISPDDMSSPAEVIRFGMSSNAGEIFYCEKKAAL